MVAIVMREVNMKSWARMLSGVIVGAGIAACQLNPVGVQANVQFGKTWQQLFAAAQVSGPNVIQFRNSHQDLFIEVEIETGEKVQLMPGDLSKRISLDPFDDLGRGRQYKAIVTYYQMIDARSEPVKVRTDVWTIEFCFECVADPYGPNLRIATKGRTGPYSIDL